MDERGDPKGADDQAGTEARIEGQAERAVRHEGGLRAVPGTTKCPKEPHPL
jgi:hypothetical protein